VNAVADHLVIDVEMLADIIQREALYPHFQPILDITHGVVLGHEALIRGPEGSPLYSPGRLFQTAISCNRLHEFELLCRRRAIEEFARLKLDGKLFLNVSASLLGTPGHQKGLTSEWLDELGIPQESIVIELSEQHPFDNYGLTRSAIEHYKGMGFQIAIDDLGAGYSGLRLWSELRPEYVKIDKHFITDVDRDPVKREFVKSIINIGQSLRCKIIAEGIETREELTALQEMGVSIGQGFLLGMPELKPELNSVQEVFRLPRKAPVWQTEAGDTAFVLLKNTPTLMEGDRLQEAAEAFEAHSDLQSMPVLSDGRPLGIVRKADLLELFSQQYGRALFEKKTVGKILVDDVLTVESDTPLEQVSRMITEHTEAEIQRDIIITQDGYYLGTGSLRDLLKRITENKIRSARYANPLTLLPGNVPINNEITALLDSDADFHVAYFDLNNFKPYNDSYGYSRGDQVIRFVGDLLTRFAGDYDNFIGHIGGDDFVAIFRSDDWQEMCQQIVAEFDRGVRQFYSTEDLEQEGIFSVDRCGNKLFYPLLGLAVGIVHPDARCCTSFHEVSELAAQAKKEAKRAIHSNLFVSRRRHHRPADECC